MDRERIGISKQELIAMLEVKHVTDVLKKMLSTVYLLQAKKIEASFLLRTKPPMPSSLAKTGCLSYQNLLLVHALAWHGVH